jgi:predicted RND superfamily exporter protein
MDYNRIISVTGLGGLFELLSSKSDGAIVRSLEDKSTRFVSSRVHNFSHLESIEVYTQRENVNLVDVLNAMEGSEERLPSEKDAAAVTSYFQKVYPDMDFERVYTSDMKKMIRWFRILKDNDVVIKLSEAEEVEETEEPVEAAVEEVEEKPKKKAAKKKAEPEATGTAVAEEKPKKKAAKKK